ncbi:MAG: cation transporting ATPase C-terminal domain-containing protein, partial [Bacilli bacterium]
HIGVSMGITGTDVAKQASSMILMDDNFATIVYAVEEGRNIYNKIKKAVTFVLATNLGEVSAIFIAVLIGVGEPLSAIHVLWVNLIVESLIAIPIGMDVNDESVMDEKPRPQSENIFTGSIASTLILSISIVIALLGSYLLTLQLDYSKEIAMSVSFMVMASAPMIYILSLRSKKLIIFSKPWENKALSIAIIVGISLNLILIYTPLNTFFDLVPLYNQPLFIALGAILIPTIILEIIKLIKK